MPNVNAFYKFAPSELTYAVNSILGRIITCDSEGCLDDNIYRNLFGENYSLKTYISHQFKDDFYDRMDELGYQEVYEKIAKSDDCHRSI